MIEPIDPPIMSLPIWREAKSHLSPQKNGTKTRGHFNFRMSTPEGLRCRLLKLETPCCKCGQLMHPVRGHRNNNKILSLHVSGPRSTGHQWCSYGNEAKAQIIALQLEVGQGGETIRVQKAKEDRRQQRFAFKE